MILANFPAKLQFLFAPARYKIPFGGRGSGKSWGVARALLLLGAQKKLRIFCGRETQKSMADSVIKLLGDQVIALGLEAFYLVQKTSIVGANGTEFVFAGLRHNVNNIKSLESCDIAWIEEAQSVSKSSWEVLIPTIRKEGSEIWVTFNPELESDDTYQRFVVHPPPGAIVRKINWSDNPWFPGTLRAEKDHLAAVDPDAHLHVWEGHCRQMLEGAVYANELRAARAAGRICRVPYDCSKPVHTFWDLGFADNTSVWMVQTLAMEFRVIDFYQSQFQPLAHYLKVLQERGYLYGTDWLPHDARAHSLGTGRSIEELMREQGRRVSIVPRLSLVDGINAARTIFPQCYFDESRCSDGLSALMHYRYQRNERTGEMDREPLHDHASHAADAFRYVAVAIKNEQRNPENSGGIPPRRPIGGGNSWMA